jgi:DNA-binding NarL/FixJ family response regulator
VLRPDDTTTIAQRAEQVRLTARELVVLSLLAEGLTATSIARRMHISPRTVHRHLGHVYRKLGASDRLAAVVRGQRLGLLAVPQVLISR